MATILARARCGILNPVRLFNRIITGDAWRVRTSHNLYHDYNRIPVDATVMIGGRYVADENSIARGSRNLRFGFHLDYGDSYADEPTQPYDYFTADIGFNVGTQPFLSDVHLIGRLYGHNIYEGKRFRAQWGIFQHFDYYASDSIRGSEMKNPFEISETAALRTRTAHAVSGYRQSVAVGAETVCQRHPPRGKQE